MTDRSNPDVALPIVGIAIALLVPIAAHMWAGTFSRFVADDFCTAGTLQKIGFLASQQYWYTQWSGRYAFTFVISLSQFVGPWLSPFLVPSAVVVWLACLTALCRQLFQAARTTAGLLLSFGMGSAILVGTLDATPNVYQSFYWQTGLLTYTLPLIVMTALVAWILSRSDARSRPWPRGLEIGAAAGIAFFAGGFSETTGSLQVGVLILLAIVIRLAPNTQTRQRGMGLVLAALGGSLAALAVIFWSPGSHVRQSLMERPPGVLSLVGWSIRDAFLFFARGRHYPWLATLTAFLVGIVGSLSVRANGTSDPKAFSRRVLPYLAALPVIAFMLVVASISPSEYATSNYPADRALIAPQYTLSLAAGLAGLLLGAALRPVIPQSTGTRSPLWRLTATSVMAVTVVGSTLATVRIATQLPVVSTFAMNWDERDRQLREAVAEGQSVVAVASLPHIAGLGEVDGDPTNWVNVCMARTYGIKTIVPK